MAKFYVTNAWVVAYCGEHETPEEAACAGVKDWVENQKCRLWQSEYSPRFAVPPCTSVWVSESKLPLEGKAEHEMFCIRVKIDVTYKYEVENASS